jgi:AcrR family transcriptional regulator
MQRRYVLKERAQTQADTRQRIVEATASLHEEIGPKATTISAIAERAGVQRLTVYRHFSNESDLFEACTSHWLALHPPPDPERWSARSGTDRCQAALVALYAYYRRTERMWDASYRDEPEVPALRRPMDRFRRYLAGISDELLRSLSCPAKARRAARVTINHALRFTTWQSLAAEGLGDEAMARLVTGWLAGARQP